MKKIRGRTLALTVAGGSVLALVAGTGGAVASGLIHGDQIAAHTITGQNIAGNTITKSKIGSGAVGMSELNDAVKQFIQDQGSTSKNPAGVGGPAGPAGPAGPPGATGPQGPAGIPGWAGAVYRVANYTNGGGGRATVACADDPAISQEYTAVSGGAEVEVPNAGTNTEPIVASFPGRMDWSKNLPYPNRLDGWVVYFGNGAAPSAANGGTLKIWALCVPNTSIPVQTNNY
jgi:hypothetical protein